MSRRYARVDLVCDKVLASARTLTAGDGVVLEATGNMMAIVKLLKPHVRRVVIANLLQIRVIAEAKARTDRIDVAPPGLVACGWLPARDVAAGRGNRLAAQSRLRRVAILKGTGRTKNRIHSVSHVNPIPPFAGKLFLGPDRKWLVEQPPSAHERVAVDR